MRMNIQFQGTHFLNDRTFRQVIKTENGGTHDRYNPETGAKELMSAFVGFGENANWESVGRLDNVWILDSGFGETEQDRLFTRALQAFADKNGLNRDDFHRFHPKRFSGSNNALTPSGEIDREAAWAQVNGQLVPSVPAKATPSEFMSLDEVADNMRPLYEKKTRGYTGSVWEVVEQLRAKLQIP